MDQQPEQGTNDKSGKRPSLPGKIDPGWATVIASALALIGTLAALWFRQPQPATPPPTNTAAVAIVQSVPATIEPLPSPTEPPPTPTDSPTPTDPPPTATRKPPPPTSTLPPPTAVATIAPATVTMILDVPPDQRATTQTTAKGLLDLSRTLPLIIRDPFDVNDYGWMEFDETYDTGVKCAAEIRDGAYYVSVTSPTTARSPVWCMPTGPRRTGNFYLSFDARLARNQRADVMLYYRYVDESNFYYLMFNPQTQLLSMGVEQDGGYRVIIDRAFVPEIKPAGANTVAILALGDQHAIYVNETLFALVEHESGIDAGAIRIGLQVYGAEQAEELAIDNVELRGD